MELNKVYNQDCITGMKNIPNQSIDLIVTDPPYLIKYKTGHRKNKAHKFCREILNDNNAGLIEAYINECYRILKDNTAMYIFCSSKTIDFFKTTCERAEFKLKNIIIWVKNNRSAGDLMAQYGQQYEMILLLNKGRRRINGYRLNDVWTFDRISGNKQVHQNQKPVDLIERCIVKHSNVGDLVFDGFMGSGTTAVAAINTGRSYFGFELDKYYYDIACDRIRYAVKNKQFDAEQIILDCL